jgi:hypothetical protein
VVEHISFIPACFIAIILLSLSQNTQKAESVFMAKESLSQVKPYPDYRATSIPGPSPDMFRDLEGACEAGAG